MVEWSLANLGAWSVQAAALVAAGAWLPTRLKIGVPRARLLVFRLLLAACVALPLAQPWEPAPRQPAAREAVATSELLEAPPVLDALPARGTRSAVGPQEDHWSSASALLSSVPSRAASLPWPLIALLVLASGTVVRLAWLGLGLVSLARLRRSSTPIESIDGAIGEALRAVGVTAGFRESARVPRPVTFGLWAPVVIVPPTFASLDSAQQLAVACHELLHVKRQDWLRTFGDEILRSLLWFHPAIWWLVEQIHLTGEQTIDREVVALVGDRRSYLRALLALAEPGDGPRLQPAAAFLDHGHLRQRVAMLMEEASMSRARLVASFAFVLAVVAAGAWWSVSAFPLRGAPEPAATAAGPASLLAGTPLARLVAEFTPVATNQAPPPPPPPAPQATKPGMPAPATAAAADEATLKRNIQLNPKDVTNYFVLGTLYEKVPDAVKAAAVYEAAIKAVPNDSQVYMHAAGFYNRQGNFEKSMDALTRRTKMEPDNPEAHYTVASYYWEKAYRDRSLSEGQKRTYIDEGIAAADRALALKPEYPEALTYKNLLLRSLALLETDENTRQQLIADADKLRDQAIAIRKARAGASGTTETAAPSPPPPGSTAAQAAAALAQLRVLETRYGDAHPDVQRLRRALADLEAKQAEEMRASTLQFLESQLSDARSQLVGLLQRYGPQHPDVMAAQQRVRDLEAKISSSKAQISAPGSADIQYLKPVSKRENDMIVTTFEVKNVSTGPIERLTIEEFWYDKAGNLVTGGKQFLEKPLMQGETATITLNTPTNTKMDRNSYKFSHQNGAIRPKLVPKF